VLKAALLKLASSAPASLLILAALWPDAETNPQGVGRGWGFILEQGRVHFAVCIYHPALRLTLPTGFFRLKDSDDLQVPNYG
jgi:hypothetical protein